MDDAEIAEVRRLIRQMEDEAVKYNDQALVRRIKFWRRMLREELARRGTDR